MEDAEPPTRAEYRMPRCFWAETGASGWHKDASHYSKRSALGCGAAIAPESISNDGVHISETQRVPFGLRANSEAVGVNDMVLGGPCHV